MLFDPEVQPPESDLVRLFVLIPRGWWETPKSDISTRFIPIRNRAQFDLVWTSYSNWVEEQRNASLRTIASSPTEQQNWITRHKARLDRLGVTYRGVRDRGTKERRFTHCYDCKRKLETDLNSDCMSCGWLVCSCGACGCGYSFA